MLNYKKMTAKEAIRAAKEESDLTAEQIARRLNVSTSVIRRYLKEDDNYFPGLEMLPRLCLERWPPCSDRKQRFLSLSFSSLGCLY